MSDVTRGVMVKVDEMEALMRGEFTKAGCGVRFGSKTA